MRFPDMPNPDSVHFCLAYAGCLAAVAVAALEGIRRLLHPATLFVLGVLALAAIFCLTLWLEGGLVSAGEWSAQMAPPYRYFRRGAFALCLMLFLVRGAYLLRGKHSHGPLNGHPQA